MAQPSQSAEQSTALGVGVLGYGFMGRTRASAEAGDWVELPQAS